jgi:hypothetical protein
MLCWPRDAPVHAFEPVFQRHVPVPGKLRADDDYRGDQYNSANKGPPAEDSSFEYNAHSTSNIVSASF